MRNKFQEFVCKYLKTLLPAISFLLVLSLAHSAEDFSIPAKLASASLLTGAVSVNGIIAAVGERGHILLSTDNGDNWNQARVPTRSTLTAVWFHDRNLGWAVGHDAVILKTRDGGKNWQRLYFAPEKEQPLFDVWFGDPENGIAVGAYGLYLATDDGGKTWTERAISQDDFHLYSICPSLSGNLYIAGEMGTVYLSMDEGSSWEKLNPPHGGSFFGAIPLKNYSMLFFGLRGNIFRFNEKKMAWDGVPSKTEASLMGGTVLKDGNIVLVGLGGTILRGDGEARTFSPYKIERLKGLVSVLENNDGGLFVFGETGVFKIDNLNSHGVGK